MRDNLAMEEMILKAAYALLAGLASFIGDRLRKRREDHAAAVVVLGALREALDKTYEPHLHPVRPVVVPFPPMRRCGAPSARRWPGE